MSPWLLLLVIPLAIGVSVSDAIFSFVEDLEAAADPTRGLGRQGDEGSGGDADPDPDPVVIDIPDAPGGLFSLLSGDGLAGDGAAAGGGGSAAMSGGMAEDMLRSLSTDSAALETELNAKQAAEVGKEAEVEVPLDQPTAFTKGEDQLTVYLSEAQPGEGQAILSDLMFNYDAVADQTTLAALDQPLTTLAGDQRGLSVALYDATDAPRWLDAEGAELTAAEGEAADIILSLLTLQEMALVA